MMRHRYIVHLGFVLPIPLTAGTTSRRVRSVSMSEAFKYMLEYGINYRDSYRASYRVSSVVSPS